MKIKYKIVDFYSTEIARVATRKLLGHDSRSLRFIDTESQQNPVIFSSN